MAADYGTVVVEQRLSLSLYLLRPANVSEQVYAAVYEPQSRYVDIMRSGTLWGRFGSVS